MKRIVESTVNHNGRELPCYIPQVNLGEGWKDALEEGSYILKETYNPLEVCVCGGNGCKACHGIGLRRGQSEDNRYIAEFFCERKELSYLKE